MSIFNVLHICAFALAVSVFVCGFMGHEGRKVSGMKYARYDAHLGGVGVAAGMVCALIAMFLFYPNFLSHRLLLGLGGLGACVAVLGAAHERDHVPHMLRLSLMALIAALTPMVTGAPKLLPMGIIVIPLSPLAGMIIGALWVFIVMNVVSVMDGANGLMGSFMLIACAGLCAVSLHVQAGDVLVITAALAFAIFGLLIYNSRASTDIVCGSAGTFFIGFIFAAATLRLTGQVTGMRLVYVGPLLLLPILTDAVMTIMVQLRRKHPVLGRDKTHLYQYALKEGRSDLAISFAYMIAALVAVIAVFIGVRTGFIGSAFYAMMWACLANWIYLAVFVRYRRKLQTPN